VETRLIFASNAGLDKLSDESIFRKDLFYRIEGNIVELPPLRERDDDILLLICYFLTSFSSQYSVIDSLDLPALKDVLLSYSWPGNVRELRNFCKFIMINERKINNSVIKKHLQQKNNQSLYYRNSDNAKYLRIHNIKKSIASFEKDYLLYYLSLNNWKVAQTADVIGLERTTLYKKIKALGINHLTMEE